MFRLLCAMFLVPTVVFAAGCSCGNSDPGRSAETQQKADKLQEIQQRTNGDWNKLTQEDKDYLINKVAHGSESTARMLLGPPVSKKGGK